MVARDPFGGGLGAVALHLFAHPLRPGEIQHRRQRQRQNVRNDYAKHGIPLFGMRALYRLPKGLSGRASFVYGRRLGGAGEDLIQIDDHSSRRPPDEMIAVWHRVEKPLDALKFALMALVVVRVH